MSSDLSVGDWRILPCPRCDRITRYVRGKCDRCGLEVRDE